MTGNSAQKVGWREMLPVIRREFTRPEMILFLSVTLSKPLWITPMSYFYVWTYTFADSGIVAWFAIIALSVLAIWCMITVLIKATAFGKILRPFRLAAQNGDQEAVDLYRAKRLLGPSRRKVLLIFPCLALSAPALIAIVLMSGDDGGLYLIKDHGKLRHSTRQEDLHMKLLALQKHGVFTPMTSKDR